MCMHDGVFERLGLRENPFKINPDPRYLFATPELKEAVAELTDGFRERCGCMLLTGDVGTGKTTVVNHLIRWLRDQGMPTALICYTHVDMAQFFDLMLAGFGIPCVPQGKGDAQRTFHEWLAARNAAGDRPVVVIDEAQGLSFRVLEEVRLLLNLEMPQQKLLQILLAGESSLSAKLDSTDLRQLRQRISVRRHIAPFSMEQTRAYIETRLRIANGGGAPLFTAEAVQTVHLHSLGVARVINTLCERALLNAYAQEEVPVPAHIVDEVAAELLPAAGRWAAPMPVHQAAVPEASVLPEAPARVAAPLAREIATVQTSPATLAAANAAVLISLMGRKRVPPLPLPRADAAEMEPTPDRGANIPPPASATGATTAPWLPADLTPPALSMPRHWDLLVPRPKVSEFRPTPPAEPAKHAAAKRPENKLESLLATAQKRAAAIGRRELNPFRVGRVRRLSERIAWGPGRRRAEEFARRALFMALRISWYEVDLSAFTRAAAERKTREWLRWLREPVGGAASEAKAPIISSIAGSSIAGSSTAGPRLYWSRLPRLYSASLSQQTAVFLRWLRQPVRPAHAIRSRGARTPRGAE